MENWITTKIKLDPYDNEINRFLFKKITINSNGNNLVETEYDSESNVVFNRFYKYFDTGELKEFIEYDPSDDLLQRQTMIKNDFGEIYKHEFEYSEGQKTVKEFHFTDLGNADKAVITDENNEIIGYEIYIFDNSWRIIKEIEYDSDNNEILKFEKEYNEDGTIKIEKNFRDGILFYIELFEYDNNSNVIKKLHKNYRDNFELIDEYEFDTENNMIYNSTHQNGFLVFENKCEYDNLNRLISEEFFEIDYWEKQIIRHEKLIHEIEN